jgi:hypothetical protein
VQKVSKKQHLKGVAGVEASSPSTGIRASAQYPCSEVTCHHGGLTHGDCCVAHCFISLAVAVPCACGLCIFTWSSDRMR